MLLFLVRRDPDLTGFQNLSGLLVATEATYVWLGRRVFMDAERLGYVPTQERGNELESPSRLVSGISCKD